MRALLAALCVLLVVVQAADPTQYTYTLTVKGKERTYYAYVPSTYKSGVATAAVVYIHGYNMNCANTNEVAGYTALAVQRVFITLTPCALGNPTQWSVDDVDFIQAMLTDAKSKYTIDSNRLYLTGFSNGGAMTIMITCRHSDWFTGAASGSGWNMQESMGNYTLSNRQTIALCDSYYAKTAHPIPMLHVHGEQDDLVAYYGFTGLPSVRDDFYGFALRNGCKGSPTTVEETTVLKDEVFEDCPENAGARLITLYNVGHAWVRNAQFDQNTVILDYYKVTAEQAKLAERDAAIKALPRSRSHKRHH